MTTTNNNREYAIRLYYEVREADNSLNCKTSYKVFDNMQDAANYAIDFIANNPDANIRLTNEHFNGSQISVYGDSSSTNYDLTDADINAVRNVEVNEVDVEDYAVTEEAQDVATNSEIRNANTASGNYSETIYTDVRNGRKIFESVTYKNHSIVRIESLRYGLTLDTTFRGNKVFKHNGRRIAAKAVAEVYMNRERADEQDKIFRAYFANIPNNRGCFEVWAFLTYADGKEHTYMFKFNQTKQVEQFKQEVQSFAADNNTPCQIYVKIRPYKSNVTAWVDPHQYGEPGNLEQPRDISVYCNEPATNVTADEDTVFAAYEAAINGDRAYVLKAQELFTAHADGDTLRSFQLDYAQDRKQYGENISQALRALGDNRSEGYNEKLQSLIDTWVAESDKVLTVNKSIFNQRLIEALIQKFDEHREHVNEPATPTVAELEAEIANNLRAIDEAYTELEAIEAEVGDEDCLTPQEHIDYLNDFIAECRERVNECRDQIDSIKAEGDFAREYAQAAAATDRIRKIDPDAEIIFAADEPPADDFKAKLAALKAKAADAHNAEQAAQRLLDEAEAAYKKAEDSHRDAYLDAHNADVAIKKFLADKAKELRDNLLDDDIFNGKIAIIAQGGKRFNKPELGQIWIDFREEESQLIIFSSWNNFAIYDTPAQVTAAVELLRDAIKHGDKEFAFPTVAELEATDTVDRLNAAAPEGWSVVPDPDNKKFFVKAGGKSVAEIDSLALAKVLPPDKFFARFTPLTDDEPNQRYADQLYQEYLELLDMRDNLSDDPERLKVIDGLIRDLEREMLAARLDLPTSTPTSTC